MSTSKKRSVERRLRVQPDRWCRHLSWLPGLPLPWAPKSSPATFSWLGLAAVLSPAPGLLELWIQVFVISCGSNLVTPKPGCIWTTPGELGKQADFWGTPPNSNSVRVWSRTVIQKAPQVSADQWETHSVSKPLHFKFLGEVSMPWSCWFWRWGQTPGCLGTVWVRRHVQGSSPKVIWREEPWHMASEGAHPFL